jgi:molybdopterin synthase sulfur carrier subunit
MPRVFFPPQLRDLTGGAAEADVAAANVRQAIAGLDEQFPGLAARLRCGDALAPGIAVSIDGVMSARGLLAPLGPASQVHFIPAIGGG